MLTSRLHEDQPHRYVSADPRNPASGPCQSCGKRWRDHLGKGYAEPQPIDVCDRCHQPVHRAAPDADPDAARWYHNEVADDVFCGVVMHAADRAAGR